LENIDTYEGGKPIELVVREFGIKEQDVLKLASNENPNGTSSRVINAIKEYANRVSIYPDDSMTSLKTALADRFSLKSENIIIGAGSDQIIDFAIRAKANKSSKILTAGVTFAMYEIYAKHIGVDVLKTSSSTHNLEELLKIYNAYKESIGIIFLCLPNNPLGESIESSKVYEFLNKIDENTLVVIDGAYQEYASFKDSKYALDPKDILDKFNNVLYLGTFSKAYGLGGMRVGYGLSNKGIIEVLYKLRPPFNITTLSLIAATQALKDEEFVNKSVELNFTQMKRYEEFADKNKIDYIDSYTNFITLIFNEKYSSKLIADILLRQGIIVRDLTSYGLNALRVTIAKPEQNSRFLESFEKILLG
jgi:histidinol-phosphate aminotransferase